MEQSYKALIDAMKQCKQKVEDIDVIIVEEDILIHILSSYLKEKKFFKTPEEIKQDLRSDTPPTSIK